MAILNLQRFTQVQSLRAINPELLVRFLLPHNLAEALYFINEMATADGMDELLEEAENRDALIEYHPDSTPEDVAIQVWLSDRGIVEKKHAERFLHRPKSFEYFQSEEGARPIGRIAQKKLEALERDLDDYFEKKKRGRNSKVFFYPKGDEVWFLVRHGEPFKREGGIKDGHSPPVFFAGLKLLMW